MSAPTEPQPATDEQPETSRERLYITVDRDGWTKGLQLGISQLDDNNAGHGYRLYGPKYNGSSRSVIRYELDARDAAEIRKMLDSVFPLNAATEEQR